MEWYHADITRDEAEKLLIESGKNSFLVRKSSQPNSYGFFEHLFLAIYF